MKRILKTFGLIILLTLLGGILFLLSPSGGPVAYASEVDFQTSSQNANLAAALYAGGVVDPFVDIDEERAYVAYDLPEGADVEITQRFVVGATASAAPDSAKLIILQYVDGRPRLLWNVDAADFAAFMRGEISETELDAKIVKRSF